MVLVLGVGKVPWLSPLPAASGKRLSRINVSGITHLVNECSKRLCNLVVSGLVPVVVPGLVTRQVIRCILLGALLWVIISVLCMLRRVISCVLTLLSLT